ncbi:MAG TPA: hypothetical protein VFC78_08595 [Tepidisphaeraceae bacterium]|nr:hypothetical protein [Tepidisphaeraceae bacterium]
METLAEIESAVDRLPLEQQQALLHHLGASVRRQCGGLPSSVREQWMNRLDELRRSIGSGKQALTTEQILAESREERN